MVMDDEQKPKFESINMNLLEDIEGLFEQVDHYFIEQREKRRNLLVGPKRDYNEIKSKINTNLSPL